MGHVAPAPGKPRIATDAASRRLTAPRIGPALSPRPPALQRYLALWRFWWPTTLSPLWRLEQLMRLYPPWRLERLMTLSPAWQLERPTTLYQPWQLERLTTPYQPWRFERLTTLSPAWQLERLMSLSPAWRLRRLTTPSQTGPPPRQSALGAVQSTCQAQSVRIRPMRCGWSAIWLRHPPARQVGAPCRPARWTRRWFCAS